MSYKRLAAAVNDLLFDVWDPIPMNGEGPRDEYETYVPVLIRLARTEDGVHAIAARLLEIELDSLGVAETTDAHRLGVARQLVALVRASGWEPRR